MGMAALHRKPSPSGRGWGEGETPPTANPAYIRQPAHHSLPHRHSRESGNPRPGLRRNGGRVVSLMQGWRRRATLPLPNPLPLGEGLLRLAPHHRHSLPLPSFPAPHRHSRESGNPPPNGRKRRKAGAGICHPCGPHRHSGVGRNPEPRLPRIGGRPGVWIPVFAGMTVRSGRNDGGGVGASRKPSPSGRGWGEGETLITANPAYIRQPARHSREGENPPPGR